MLTQIGPAFPGSSQVALLGLDTADDSSIWNYAKKEGYTLVTQDSDFHELAMLQGDADLLAPPGCCQKTGQARREE